jgi:hypothetical protein
MTYRNRSDRNVPFAGIMEAAGIEPAKGFRGLFRCDVAAEDVSRHRQIC